MNNHERARVAVQYQKKIVFITRKICTCKDENFMMKGLIHQQNIANLNV